MYFHNKDSEGTTSFLRTLMPGEEVTKFYTFKALKSDIPWMIVYTQSMSNSNVDNLLKWDITPDQYKGMSSNANLKTVETDHGSNIKEISVSSNIDKITLNPIAEDEKATISGNGTYPLNVGVNTFKIVVTSEMGTTKEYDFIVKRLAGNANLSSLTFNDGTLTPAFSENTTEYTLKLTKNDFTLGIYPTKSDSKASISYKSSIYINGYSDMQEVIRVTAEDGTVKEYTINIICVSKDKTLNNIILNEGTIDFTFNSNSYTQNVRVNANVESLNVQAIPTNSNATIESGNGIYNLEEGENEILIKVVAEDSRYTQYYTLKVYRTNNNTNLKGIYFGSLNAKLIDGFDPNKTEYELEIVRYQSVGDIFELYAVPENSKTTVKYSYGNTMRLVLNLGINEFKFTCTSEQGDTKVYTLRINYRNPSSNGNIKNLKFDVGTMEPEFNPEIKSYTIKVPRYTNYINITEIEKEDKNAFVMNTQDGSYTTRLELPELDNTLTFRVRAEDDSITEYKFNIIKARNSDPSLESLYISHGELEPKFDKNIKNYTATVWSVIDEILIIGNPTEYYTSTVTGDGNKKLQLGENRFTIAVTAEDGSKDEYFINVVRNNLPVISGGDITIPYGDEIDLLKGITASDVEDGDITSKIKATPMQSPINGIGTYEITYSVKDSLGQEVYKTGKLHIVERNIKVTDAIGSDRYDTAVKLSKLKFTKSNVAVLVNGYALADGLAVTPLAAYYNAPILLTSTNSIPQQTLNELKRLGVTKVIIAGGNGVVTNNVVTKLNSIGIKNVDRVAGIDRYQTSLEIAKYIDKNCYDVNTVAVCYGYGEADALSISAVAARDRMAIIMADKNSISSNVESWLRSEDLVNAYIVGGTGVVSNNVLNKINSLTQKDISKNRIGGTDRYHTNAIVIDRFYGDVINKIYLANGTTLVDALAAGVVGALDNAPVMLANTQDLTTEQHYLLNEIKGTEIIKAGGGMSKGIIEMLVNQLKY